MMILNTEVSHGRKGYPQRPRNLNDWHIPLSAVSALMKAQGLLGTDRETRVLEVGCGACQLLERLESPLLWGTDIDERRVTLARGRLQDKAVVLRCTTVSLPFPDACFDRVVASGVVGQLDDPLPFLQEMIRVLRADGMLLLPLDHTNRTRLLRPLRIMMDCTGVPENGHTGRHGPSPRTKLSLAGAWTVPCADLSCQLLALRPAVPCDREPDASRCGAEWRARMPATGGPVPPNHFATGH